MGWEMLGEKSQRFETFLNNETRVGIPISTRYDFIISRSSSFMKNTSSLETKRLEKENFECFDLEKNLKSWTQNQNFPAVYSAPREGLVIDQHQHLKDTWLQTCLKNNYNLFKHWSSQSSVFWYPKHKHKQDDPARQNDYFQSARPPHESFSKTRWWKGYSHLAKTLAGRNKRYTGFKIKTALYTFYGGGFKTTVLLNIEKRCFFYKQNLAQNAYEAITALRAFGHVFFGPPCSASPPTKVAGSVPAGRTFVGGSNKSLKGGSSDPRQWEAIKTPSLRGSRFASSSKLTNRFDGLSGETLVAKPKFKTLALLGFDTTQIEFWGSLKIYAKRKFLKLWYPKDSNLKNKIPLWLGRLQSYASTHSDLSNAKNFGIQKINHYTKSTPKSEFPWDRQPGTPVFETHFKHNGVFFLNRFKKNMLDREKKPNSKQNKKNVFQATALQATALPFMKKVKPTKIKGSGLKDHIYFPIIKLRQVGSGSFNNSDPAGRNRLPLSKLILQPQITRVAVLGFGLYPKGRNLKKMVLKRPQNMICYAYAMETIQNKKPISSSMDSFGSSSVLKNTFKHKPIFNSKNQTKQAKNFEAGFKNSNYIQSLSCKVSCFSYFGYDPISSLNLRNKPMIPKNSTYQSPYLKKPAKGGTRTPLFIKTNSETRKLKINLPKIAKQVLLLESFDFSLDCLLNSYQNASVFEFCPVKGGGLANPSIPTLKKSGSGPIPKGVFHIKNSNGINYFDIESKYNLQASVLLFSLRVAAPCFRKNTGMLNIINPVPRGVEHLALSLAEKQGLQGFFKRAPVLFLSKSTGASPCCPPVRNTGMLR